MAELLKGIQLTTGETAVLLTCLREYERWTIHGQIDTQVEQMIQRLENLYPEHIRKQAEFWPTQ